MTVIPLAPEFLSAVLSGQKRSTIRRGTRRYEMGRAELRAGAKAVAIQITKVVYCTASELTDDDAKADGFESLADLIATLRRFYPSLTDSDEMTKVYFNTVDSEALHG